MQLYIFGGFEIQNAKIIKCSFFLNRRKARDGIDIIKEFKIDLIDFFNESLPLNYTGVIDILIKYQHIEPYVNFLDILKEIFKNEQKAEI